MRVRVVTGLALGAGQDATQLALWAELADEAVDLLVCGGAFFADDFVDLACVPKAIAALQAVRAPVVLLGGPTDPAGPDGMLARLAQAGFDVPMQATAREVGGRYLWLLPVTDGSPTPWAGPPLDAPQAPAVAIGWTGPSGVDLRGPARSLDLRDPRLVGVCGVGARGLRCEALDLVWKDGDMEVVPVFTEQAQAQVVQEARPLGWPTDLPSILADAAHTLEAQGESSALCVLLELAGAP